MNVLFIYSVDDALSLDKPLRTQEEMQFGISYISSILKSHGHHTDLVVLSRMLGKKNMDTIDAYIRKIKPQLICFTAVASEYPFVYKIASYVKNRYPYIDLMIGGSHISLNPEVAGWDVFDALCIGEGEYPVLEYVAQLEKGYKPSGIRNLWIRGKAGIEKNGPRPFLQDIDLLPFPDREMWQEWVDTRGRLRPPVLLGRGCPFQCTYCCNHALSRLAEGPYLRFRSPDNIVDEIKDIIVHSPATKDFYLEVETIGANKRWAIELCSRLENLNKSFTEPLSFGTNLRITSEADLESLFIAFKKSNFKFVRIGVESGSERVRREILKRNYSNQDIINTVRLARRYGIKISFYNLIGVPGESIADFRETIKINRLCLPDQAYAHIFFPYPGTELYALCAKQGLLKKIPDTELERCRATLDLQEFSKRDIQKGFTWFDYYVYKGYKPMYKILTKVLISKCRSNRYLHSIYRSLKFLSFFKRMRLKYSRLISLSQE